MQHQRADKGPISSTTKSMICALFLKFMAFYKSIEVRDKVVSTERACWWNFHVGVMLFEVVCFCMFNYTVHRCEDGINTDIWQGCSLICGNNHSWSINNTGNSEFVMWEGISQTSLLQTLPTHHPNKCLFLLSPCSIHFRERKHFSNSPQY